MRIQEILKKQPRPEDVHYNHHALCGPVYDSYTGITYSSLGRCAQTIHWSVDYIMMHPERFIILMKN